MAVRGEGKGEEQQSWGIAREVRRSSKEFGRVGSASCFFRFDWSKKIYYVWSRLGLLSHESHAESNRVNDVPNSPDPANQRAYSHIRDSTHREHY